MGQIIKQKECENCGDEFKARISKNPLFTKRFCCLRCRVATQRRRRVRERGIDPNKWNKENKEKYNKSVMENYKRNKKKWYSRIITGQYIIQKKIVLQKECNQCRNKSKLQIHHEIYPTKIVELRKAIKDKKIYYLCIKHHGELGVGRKNEKTTKDNITGRI
jgi:hypothetical protein|tara:strand:+ start:103 stop:588 length:486 start_codon:yes stop_codon:yes gene_type:complete